MVRKVKVFSLGYYSCEKEINKFLKKTNATPISISIYPMHDLQYNGDVCNQWQEVILIYDVESDEVIE